MKKTETDNKIHGRDAAHTAIINRVTKPKIFKIRAAGPSTLYILVHSHQTYEVMSGPYENVEMKNAQRYKHGRVSHNQKKVLKMAVIHGPARCCTAMPQGVSLHVKAGGVRLDRYLKRRLPC